MLTHNSLWNRYIHGQGLLLLILTAAALAQWLNWAEFVQYDRTAVLQGQIWRLWTAHLLHLGWPHYLLNAAGLILIWLLFHTAASPIGWTWHFLFAGLAVSLGLLLFNPHLQWYVGLSGVLHALFIAGLLLSMAGQWRFTLLVLLIVMAKIIWEQLYGPLPGSEQTAAGPVVVDAHLYGAVAGFISYGIHYAFKKLKIHHRGTEDTEIKKGKIK